MVSEINNQYKQIINTPLHSTLNFYVSVLNSDMRYLLFIPFLLQLVFTDTIIIEKKISPVYTKVNKIDNIEFLGINDNNNLVYKSYGSNNLTYIHINDVSKVLNNNGEEINPYDKLYKPVSISNVLDERITNIEKKDKNLKLGPAGLLLGLAGICHILKTKYMYDQDIDNIDEFFDHTDKYEKFDKAEGYFLFMGGIAILASQSNKNNDNFSYMLNPNKSVPHLNLSFKF